MKVEDEFTLSVGPKQFVKTIYQKRDINELRFYPDNPRISSIVIDKNPEDLNDAVIYDLMQVRQSEATKTLYQEVKKDGQINEPLIVYQNLVLEGNTRLWVARTLYADTGLEEWKEIPCRIVEGVLEPKQIDYILCNCHIRKKRDWQPFEQACYFYRMNVKERRTIKEIADLTGVGQNKITDYINTFKEMKSRNTKNDEFSTYYETIKEPEVKKAERMGIRIIDVIEREIKKGEIKDAKDVRKLKKILKDDVATKKLIDGEVTIYRAEKIAVTRKPEQEDEFLKSLIDIKYMLENAKSDYIESLGSNPRKLKIVKDFIETVENFSKFLK